MQKDIQVLFVGPSPDVATKIAGRIENERPKLAVEPVENVDEGLDLLTGKIVDCVVSTDQLGNENGSDFLEAVSARSPDLPVIFFPADGIKTPVSKTISSGGSSSRKRTRSVDTIAMLADRIETVVNGTRTAQEYREAETRYQDLFAEMNEGMALCELVTDESGTPVDYQILEVNQQFAEIVGLEQQQVEGALATSVYETAEPPFLERFSQVVETGESVEFEAKFPPLSRHFHISAFRPKAGRFAVLFSDVSARKQAKRALQEQTAKLEEAVDRRESAEARYRSLFENNPVVIWEEDFSKAKSYVDEIAAEHPDVAGYLAENPQEVEELFDRIEIIDVNQKALSYYEAETKAELMDNLGRLMTEDSLSTNRELWQTIADGETRFRSETVSQTLEGEQRDEILEYRVPDEATEDYSRVFVTSIDITERRERERERQSLKERLELALEGAQLGVWDWDMEAEKVYRDERVVRMLGYDPGEVGNTITEFMRWIHPDDTETHRTALNEHIEGDADFYRCAYRLRTAAGSWKWIQNVGKVVEWGDDGTPLRAVGIHEDVDEKFRTRQRLEQRNELLQAIDRILRHNLHNDMNVVQGYARTIEERAAGQLHSHAKKITETSQKLLETVDKERSVVESLSDTWAVKSVDIVDIAESIVSGIRADHPAAEIRLNAPDSLSVRAIETIGRALEELVQNAVLHADTSASVDIDIGTGNDRAWIRVAETGPPIPEMERAVLTEDGEITPLYHGSGFGLWLVSHVVRQSDGALSFDERVPRGNVVTIELQRPGTAR